MNDKRIGSIAKALVIAGAAAVLLGGPLSPRSVLLADEPSGDAAPWLTLSDTDKVSLEVRRAADGMLQLAMLGDVFDARGSVGAAMGRPPAPWAKNLPLDLDADVKVGKAVGFDGETLRQLEFALSLRAGEIGSFKLVARLGRDATLSGDVRRDTHGRRVLYLETDDAGALARFAGLYPHLSGGRMWLAMDLSPADPVRQQGVLRLRDFALRGEPALDRLTANEGLPPDGARKLPGEPGVAFTNFRAGFIRSPGKLDIRNAIALGPRLGLTLEGRVDLEREDIHMRGILVLAQQLLVPQWPGQDQPPIAMSFDVTGSVRAPILRINPFAPPLTPGFLRKLFEFDAETPPAAPP